MASLRPLPELDTWSENFDTLHIHMPTWPLYFFAFLLRANFKKSLIEIFLCLNWGISAKFSNTDWFFFFGKNFCMYIVSLLTRGENRRRYFHNPWCGIDVKCGPLTQWWLAKASRDSSEASRSSPWSLLSIPIAGRQRLGKLEGAIKYLFYPVNVGFFTWSQYGN